MTTTALKSIKVSVIEAGILTIPSNFTQAGETSYSGNLADYEYHTPEQLYRKACQMAFVERNAKTIAGAEYSLHMAVKDFNKYAV